VRTPSFDGFQADPPRKRNDLPREDRRSGQVVIVLDSDEADVAEGTQLDRPIKPPVLPIALGSSTIEVWIVR
jgi:hypothetical protein